MSHDQRERREQLNAEVSVRHRIHAVLGVSVEPERRRRHLARDGVGRSCQSAGSQRGDVHSRHRITKPCVIALEHSNVGEQMMCEAYRLCSLQMRVSGHYIRLVCLSNAEHRVDQLEYQRLDLVDLISHIEPYVDRDLVVAASRRVESFSGVTDPLGQHRFDEHMYILSLGIYRESSGLYIGEYPLERCYYRIGILRGDYPALREHCRVSHRATDVMLIHHRVNVDRGVEIVGNTVDGTRRPSCPHFVLCHIIYSDSWRLPAPEP